MRRLFLFSIAGIAVACAPGKAPVTEIMVRDSLGIRIVELGRLEATGPHLSEEPLFRHGTEDGAYLFQRIWAGTLSEDGGAAVIDGAAREVVFLTPEGRVSFVVGTGEGPAEVSRPLTVHALGGDTILVEDDGNARFSLFAGAELIETVSTAGDYSLTQALMIRGLTADGQYLMTTSAYRSDFEEPWAQGTIAVFDPDRTATDSVATYDMAQRRPADEIFNPFAAVGEVIASGGAVIVGRTDRPELRWVSADGALHQIVRWTPEQDFPTQEDWDLFDSRLRVDLARVNPGRSQGDLSALIERQLERYRWDPEKPFPAFGHLIPDGAGGLWIGEYVIRGGADGPRRFAVVSSAGAFQGTITVPERFRVLAVRNGRVLGVIRDALDVESVAVFEVDSGQR